MFVSTRERALCLGCERPSVNPLQHHPISGQWATLEQAAHRTKTGHQDYVWRFGVFVGMIPAWQVLEGADYSVVRNGMADWTLAGAWWSPPGISLMMAPFSMPIDRTDHSA